MINNILITKEKMSDVIMTVSYDKGQRDNHLVEEIDEETYEELVMYLIIN